jgi:lipopolysaccharide transport system permease protein
MKMESVANGADQTARADAFEEEIVLEPPKGWLLLRFRDLWRYRELLYFLAWRDIKVRYKQTVLGAAWAIIQPLVTMVLFSIIFGRLARLPSEGIPYPIFSYAALLPWHLFARALSEAASSLTSNQNMVTKIYFPRLFLPASTILSGLVDFAIAFVVLLGMMVYYDIAPTWRILLLPALIFLALLTAMAVGLWLSALNVRFRDVRYITPFLIQVWLYATPIAYARTLIPEQWQLLYSLNPMTGVVDGFRWALLGQSIQLGPLFYVSMAVVVILFVTGLIYFQRMEQTFADLV